MSARTTGGLSLTLGLWMGLCAVRADDGGWRPVSAPPQVPFARPVVPAAEAPPTVSLGRPVLEDAPEPAPITAPPIRASLGSPLAQASYASAETSSPQTVFRMQAPDAPPPPPPGGGAVAPPPVGLPGAGDPYANGAVIPGSGGNFFGHCWDQLKDSFHRRCGDPCCSDHGEFDRFCSPISSPFLSEDPRALTEVKPLFFYQSIPGSNPVTHGGSIEYYGLQARLALTERWSIVMNKFGGLAIQPSDTTFIDKESGFSEIWIGPKYTFYRDDINYTAAAVGLTFQIPAGSSHVFQDTGSLTLSPYFSFAKSFGKLPNGYGNFNYMSTTGFAFSVDAQRSDYFYSNFHLDFDVAGQHRLYPVMELNFTRYLNKGHGPDFSFEGGDIVNFGSSNLDKRTMVTLATGVRYKIGGRENIQVGGTVEFPLTSHHDFNDFRILLDVIFRY
jgi:hypothetical protein